MPKNLVPIELNPRKNLVNAFQQAVNAGDIQDFLIVGRYAGAQDFFIGRSEMPVTDEITLAAQLSANVHIRAAQEAISSSDFTEL